MPEGRDAPGAAREDRALARRLTEVTGATVRSVYDFVNGPTPPEAIPVLVEMLDHAEHPAVREGLMRALTTPAARGVAAESVIRQFRQTDDASLRFVAANALAQIAVQHDVAAIAELASADLAPVTKRMLADCFRRLRDPRGVPALLAMLDEDGAAPFIARALVRIDPAAATPAIVILERLTQDNDRWLRERAEGALAAVRKASRAPGPRSRG